MKKPLLAIIAIIIALSINTKPSFAFDGTVKEDEPPKEMTREQKIQKIKDFLNHVKEQAEKAQRGEIQGFERGTSYGETWTCKDGMVDGVGKGISSSSGGSIGGAAASQDQDKKNKDVAKFCLAGCCPVHSVEEGLKLLGKGNFDTIPGELQKIMLSCLGDCTKKAVSKSYQNYKNGSSSGGSSGSSSSSGFDEELERAIQEENDLVGY